MARKARSTEKLLQQVNARWPSRDKSSDGWIGDAAHSSRPSDHNPDSKNIVKALDITHDPKNGPVAGVLADALLASRDPRINYIISNGRIGSGSKGPKAWAWRTYSGSNKHTKHLHLSVNASNAHTATAWDLDAYPERPARLSAVDDHSDTEAISAQSKETAVVTVDAPPAAKAEEIQVSAERDAEPSGSWIKRKWKGLTGWFSGVGGIGILGYLTDPWVIVAIAGCVLVALIIVLIVLGPGWVRAQARKQVA